MPSPDNARTGGKSGHFSIDDPAAALLVIDLQKAIDDPSWGERNNLQAEEVVARLLALWRARGMPVYHIRHSSTEPQSTYRPGQPLHEFKPETAPLAGEVVITKQTLSAFAGTPLQRMLTAARHKTIVVTGVITNNSVEATVRMGRDLGFEVLLVEDGCFTFARRDWHGRPRSADEVHAMSLANLDGEYCTVVRSADILTALGHDERRS